MDEIVFNKDLLKSKFVDIRNIINLTVMKCYSFLFTSEGLLFNAGNYIFLSIILLNVILCSVFIYKGYKNLIDKIYEIYKGSIAYKNKGPINNDNIIKTTGNTHIKKGKKGKKKKAKKKNKKKQKKKNKKNNSDIKEPPKKIKNANKNKNKSNNGSKSIKLNSSEVRVQLKISKKTLNFKDSSRNNISLLNSNIIQIYINKTHNKKSKLNIGKKPNKKLIYYSDYELNGLSYAEALKIDRRTYPQYYFSILRMKYLLAFAFFANNDYNSKSMKICLFLFIFSLYFTINCLFFRDSTMHKIYVDKGNFNFIYQIPQILYSSLISSAINSIVSYLSLSEKRIIEFKKDRIMTEKKIRNLINCLKVRFVLFFIVEFSLLFLFWYYLSCFCTVYKNTQIHLIKDTLISFGLSLVYPLLLYLIPGLFRIPSLRARRANRTCLYKISKAFHLI